MTAPWWKRFAAALLPVVLGGAAFAVAFARVQHLAVEHGQAGWRSWVIAGTTEAIALAGVLEIRARNRLGVGVRVPALVLTAGLAMSGAANIADRAAGPWGLVMAAWPVAAFALVVLLKATRPTVVRDQQDQPGTSRDQAGREDADTAPGDMVPVVWSPAGPGPAAVVPDQPVDDSIPIPADVVAAAHAAAKGLRDGNERVTKRSLGDAMRAAGTPVGNARLVALLEIVSWSGTSGDQPDQPATEVR